MLSIRASSSREPTNRRYSFSKTGTWHTGTPSVSFRTNLVGLVERVERASSAHSKKNIYLSIIVIGSLYITKAERDDDTTYRIVYAASLPVPVCHVVVCT